MSRDTDHHHKEDIYAFQVPLVLSFQFFPFWIDLFRYFFRCYLQKDEDDKELDFGSYDHEAPMPLTLTSRVTFLNYDSLMHIFLLRECV